MAVVPSSESEAQLTAMVTHLVARNQTLIGHIDQVATSVSELAQDARARQAATNKAFAALRNEMQNDSQAVRTEIQALRAELQALKAEIHSRFDAGSHIFDDFEERISRTERSLDSLRSEALRQENGAPNARQADRQASPRPDAAKEPPSPP